MSFPLPAASLVARATLALLALLAASTVPAWSQPPAAAEPAEPTVGDEMASAATDSSDPSSPLMPDTPGKSRSVRYLAYQLSYIETDAAISLLQTLGYRIITAAAPVSGPGSGPEEIRLLESGETSRPLLFQLVDPVSMSIVNDALGGQPLNDVTSGIPHQRLLIAWTDPRELQRLLSLLHDQLDVPAKQILIEALVIELTRDSIRDLGFDYSASQDGNTVVFGGEGGSFAPFTYTFTRPAAKTLLEFTGRITALVNEGDAEVLSRPSVLVLDGRQARIKVGDKFPYFATTRTDLGEDFVSDTRYVDVGIVLNLRPRASDDNSEVTMQVETQVSSSGGSPDNLLGPPVQNREVQTLVRVANNTPFIIAGLISQSNASSKSGVPGLSKIPGLGKLFQRSSKSRLNTEVIVVIIPHVVAPGDRDFSHSIAKDSDLFDRFGLTLFQNVYRVRQEDVWDLDFIRESDFYRCLEATAEIKAVEVSDRLRDSGRTPIAASNIAGLATELREWMEAPPSEGAAPPAELTEQYIGLLEGRIPGEEIFVKRMLLEIIRNLDMASAIDDSQIIFFQKKPDLAALLNVESLGEQIDDLGRKCETLELLYETEAGATSGLIFDPPAATITQPHPTVAKDDYVCEMRRKNCLSRQGDRWDRLAILLNRCYDWERGALGSRRTSVDLLKNVLVLKRVLDLNSSLPLTLEGFHPGREVVFPTEQDLRESRHLVDREAAQLFYETLDTYYAFEQQIRRALAAMARLGGKPGNCSLEPSGEASTRAGADFCSCPAAAE